MLEIKVKYQTYACNINEAFMRIFFEILDDSGTIHFSRLISYKFIHATPMISSALLNEPLISPNIFTIRLLISDLSWSVVSLLRRQTVFGPSPTHWNWCDL